MTLAPEQPLEELAAPGRDGPVPAMGTEIADPETAARLIGLVDAVREHATRLIVDLSAAPSALRVRAGDVVVELEWQPATPATPKGATAAASNGAAGLDTAHPTSPQPDTAPRGAAPVAPDTPGAHVIAAPTVGTFYRSPEPGAPPFVAEGDLVAPGRQIGIVEVMKLMIPVEADRAGRVARILVGDSEPVEYGQPLVALDVAE